MSRSSVAFIDAMQSPESELADIGLRLESIVTGQSTAARPRTRNLCHLLLFGFLEVPAQQLALREFYPEAERQFVVTGPVSFIKQSRP